MWKGLRIKSGFLGALPGYRDEKKATVSTNREQISFIPFHRLPLSCAVPHMREVLQLSVQQLSSLVSLDQKFLSGAKCSWIAQASDASKTDISKASVSQTSRKMQLHHVKSLQMRSLAFLCSDSKEGGTGRVPAPSCTLLIQPNFFFPFSFPETFTVEEAKLSTASNSKEASSASSIFYQLFELMTRVSS